MPDPILMVKSATVAAVVAAAVLLATAWRRPPPAGGSLRFGYLLSIALGFYAGCWMLGLAVTWPPPAQAQQDIDRLLLVLLPLSFIAELLAALPGRLHYLGWGMRSLVVIAATPILLDHSSFVADLAGPGTREWTPLKTTLVFATAAVVLAAVWIILAIQSAHSQGPAVLIVLAIASAAATLVVMLSGYARGGQLGVPLAGALGGCALASLRLPPGPAPTGAAGFGVVGLFAILIVGLFYSSLTMTNAALLLSGPTCCWLLTRPVRWLAVARIGIAMAVVSVAVLLAGRTFVKQSAGSPAVGEEINGAAREPSLQDYLDFGR